MKDITLSEFLSIIHNGDIDKIEKIERQYNIDVYSDIDLWYGDEIKICWNYKENKEEKIIIPDNKQDIFARYKNK